MQPLIAIFCDIVGFHRFNPMSSGQMLSSDTKLRETLVTTSRDAWKNRLIDLSRRNNLLFYRPLVNGALELPIGQELIGFLSSGIQWLWPN
jgi:hypothetical protein